MVILGEGTHLHGDFGGIEPQNLLDHQGVGNAMGQMVESTQFVRHGVADAQEGVGEGHTGHGGGIRHLLPGFGIPGAVVIGLRQILKDHLKAPQGKAVGVVRCHHGGVGFQGVGHCVDAGGGGQTPGGVHHHVCIHDGHVGHQLIVGQRILDTALLIGDDSKGCHLRAGTGGGGHGHEVGLFAHLGEGIDSLADVHEPHGHIHEVGLGMLVHDPHDLGRVHGGAAADGDDHVGLEGGHLGGAGLGAGEGRIGSHIVEAGVTDAHFIQLGLHGLGVAVVIQEGVGDEEGLLLAHNVLQLA